MAETRKIGHAFNGEDPVLDPIALLLMNTYEAERRSSLNVWKSAAEAQDPNRFAENFERLTSAQAARVQSHIDNIEDNPKQETKVPRGVAKWRDIADMVRRHGLDPEAFIRAQFAVLPIGSDPPRPEGFSGELGLQNYNRAQKIFRHEIPNALRFQKNCFQIQCNQAKRFYPHKDDEGIWLLVLRDETLPLSALWRVCAAEYIARNPKTAQPAGFGKLVDRYESLAALQYLAAPGVYTEVWGTLIPKDFHGRATALYRQLHQIPHLSQE